MSPFHFTIVCASVFACSVGRATSNLPWDPLSPNADEQMRNFLFGKTISASTKERETRTVELKELSKTSGSSQSFDSSEAAVQQAKPKQQSGVVSVKLNSELQMQANRVISKQPWDASAAHSDKQMENFLFGNSIGVPTKDSTEKLAKRSESGSSEKAAEPAQLQQPITNGIVNVKLNSQLQLSHLHGTAKSVHKTAIISKQPWDALAPDAFKRMRNFLFGKTSGTSMEKDASELKELVATSDGSLGQESVGSSDSVRTQAEAEQLAQKGIVNVKLNSQLQVHAIASQRTKHLRSVNPAKSL